MKQKEREKKVNKFQMSIQLEQFNPENPENLFLIIKNRSLSFVFRLFKQPNCRRLCVGSSTAALFLKVSNEAINIQVQTLSRFSRLPNGRSGVAA